MLLLRYCCCNFFVRFFEKGLKHLKSAINVNHFHSKMFNANTREKNISNYKDLLCIFHIFATKMVKLTNHLFHSGLSTIL